jgi:hypothetical protein
MFKCKKKTPTIQRKGDTMELTTSQQELLNYINAENAKKIEWQNAEEGRVAFLIMDDIKRWAKYGIDSVEKFEREMLIESIYNAYKDKRGVKPRWINFREMSMEELIQMEKEVFEMSEY